MERQQRLHASDITEDFVSLTDIKQYIYCPRMVYFDRLIRVTPIFGSRQENSKEQHEDYAEQLFEKRGHRWALTSVAFGVWGETATSRYA